MQVVAFAVAGILCGAAAGAADVSDHPDGSTPLEWAVFHGDVAQAKQLLAAGADVKARNAYGVTAMQLAADASNTELIRLLLKAGADPNSPNPEGETALHLVARAGNVEAAKLLLKAGAEVDPRESFGGQTPLMWAAARRHPEMVELLADKGANVNARSAVRDYSARGHGRESRQAAGSWRLHPADVCGARELRCLRRGAAEAQGRRRSARPIRHRRR